MRSEFRTEFIGCATICWPSLTEIPGCDLHQTRGSVFVYPNIGAFLGKGGIKTATELATRLLHEAHVVTVPGEAFGTAEHIRISYPVTKKNIDEGTRRMGEFLGQAEVGGTNRRSFFRREGFRLGFLREIPPFSAGEPAFSP